MTQDTGGVLPPADDHGKFLREHMHRNGLNVRSLAGKAGIDERTLNTAMDGKRSPRADTARAIADALGVPVDELWPSTAGRFRPDAPTTPSRLFPARTDIPPVLWRDVFSSTRDRIDILVYGGTFLFDAVSGFTRIITDAATRGVTVRFAVGDPSSTAIHARGNEEGIGSALASRCRMTLTRLAPVADLPGVEVRKHGTPLYTSLFLADDAVYANHHIYRLPAGDNPVLEVTRDTGAELFDKYADTFEHVWTTATPVVYPIDY